MFFVVKVTDTFSQQQRKFCPGRGKLTNTQYF